MDILEIVLKNIEIIVILAIVVFQVIAGAVVQNKKKQQRGAVNRQSPPPQTARAPQPAAERRKRKADNRVLERSLADMETNAAAKAVAKEDSRKPDARSGILLPDKEKKLTSMARTGIVWSEILRPPVSMR